jgi:tRNA isopentenyl-2-thiomethyl-A-37 hydroxylase MiaE
MEVLIMRLFNVVTVYRNGSHFPEVKEIIVLKKMPRTYLVVSSFASGHRMHIEKDDPSISLTELSALNKYIAKARKVAATMLRQYEGQCEFVSHAVRLRAELMEIQGIKIVGTD